MAAQLHVLDLDRPTFVNIRKTPVLQAMEKIELVFSHILCNFNLSLGLPPILHVDGTCYQ